MPRMPSMVVFDMSGTTVDDGDAVNRAFRETLAAYGLTVRPEDADEVMGLPKPVSIRLLIEKSGGTANLVERVAEIHKSFVSRMIAHYKSGGSYAEIPGASKVFESLKRRGVKIGINTGFSREIAGIIIDRLGWMPAGLVDSSITSDEVENGRPYPEMIRALMARFGVTDPTDVAKVGDTPADLQEGTNAGCGWVIGVTEGTHSRSRLEAHPHTHLIGTVAELPSLFGIDGVSGPS